MYFGSLKRDSHPTFYVGPAYYTVRSVRLLLVGTLTTSFEKPRFSVNVTSGHGNQMVILAFYDRLWIGRIYVQTYTVRLRWRHYC